MTWAPIDGVSVIGLGHRARQGKDEAAKAMVRATEGAAVRYAFADDLYAICRVLYGMREKDAPLLQRVGVEYRALHGMDVWVDAVYGKLLQDRPRLAILTDVRFPNEMAFVRALGGICVKVERIGTDGTQFIDPSRDPNHVTEVALQDADWDRTIAAPEGNLGLLREQAIWLADKALIAAACAKG